MSGTVVEKFNNIQKATFIENVDEFMKTQSDTYESVFIKLQEQLNDYKNLESRLTTMKSRISNKVPEIERTLDALKILDKKKESEEDIETDYEVTYGPTLATATIEKGSPVYLCLGAGLMVEHSLEEAIELLTNNLQDAKKKIESYDESIFYIQEQVVITQVSLARLHNWNVVKQRNLTKL